MLGTGRRWESLPTSRSPFSGVVDLGVRLTLPEEIFPSRRYSPQVVQVSPPHRPLSKCLLVCWLANPVGYLSGRSSMLLHHLSLPSTLTLSFRRLLCDWLLAPVSESELASAVPIERTPDSACRLLASVKHYPISRWYCTCPAYPSKCWGRGGGERVRPCPEVHSLGQ